MEVEIHRDGTIYKQRFEAGVRVSELKSIGTCDDTGTIISFKPDRSIFTNIVEFDFDQIDSRLKETSFLNAGLKIIITDERADESHSVEHHYAGGISEFVKQINVRRETLHPDPILISGEKEIEKGPVSIELALQWSDAFSETIQCYTNIIRNKDGGTHMSGLRTALTSCINGYACLLYTSDAADE